MGTPHNCSGRLLALPTGLRPLSSRSAFPCTQHMHKGLHFDSDCTVGLSLCVL